MPLFEMGLVAALSITQLLDWYSTRTILNKGGFEQNPVANKAMSIVGVDTYLFVKTVAVTAVGWYISPYPWALALLVAFYMYVIVHNWKSM